MDGGSKLNHLEVELFRRLQDLAEGRVDRSLGFSLRQPDVGENDQANGKATPHRNHIVLLCRITLSTESRQFSGSGPPHQTAAVPENCHPSDFLARNQIPPAPSSQLTFVQMK